MLSIISSKHSCFTQLVLAHMTSPLKNIMQFIVFVLINLLEVVGHFFFKSCSDIWHSLLFGCFIDHKTQYIKVKGNNGSHMFYRKKKVLKIYFGSDIPSSTIGFKDDLEV